MLSIISADSETSEDKLRSVEDINYYKSLIEVKQQ